MQIPNCEEGKTPESKIKKVLFNEVNLILAIVSICGVAYFGFFNTSYKYQKQIDELNYKIETEVKLSAQMQNIKDNDLKELHLSSDRIENLVIELQKQIVRLETKMEDNND
jgi:hypothetical protein